jgi:hypothetical protein
MTESEDAVENVPLPATSSSMTGLAVGQSWCGVAFIWGAAQPSMCSLEVVGFPQREKFIPLSKASNIFNSSINFFN